MSHVLSFLPVDSVLTGMRVDRKWERAARHAIRNREVLRLRPLAHCRDCRKSLIACPSCRKSRFQDHSMGIDVRGNYDDVKFLLDMKR